MAFCERLSEQLAVVATIDPVTGTTATPTTCDAFSMSVHRRALFILQSGLGFTAGAAVAIQEDTVAWGAAATIISAAATACLGNDSQFLFEVSGEAMAAGNDYLRAIVTPVAAPLLSMIVLADVERYHPGSDQPPSLGSVVSIQAHL